MTTERDTCRPDDSVLNALEQMREHRICRLPVVNEKGILQGILSLNDIVLEAHKEDAKLDRGTGYDEVMSTFKDICTHKAAA